MKKIFTLIAMAFVAVGVNAQETDSQGHAAGKYPVKNVVWKSITWKNGNNKKDKNNNDMLFLMGTGNGYATLLADYYYSDDKGDWFTRPAYTYISYESGETGIPAYGLYYKFTPAAAGTLKVNVWVNKGNRKTFVVKASTGAPLVPYVDYSFDGYVNGQNTNTDQPKIDPETGQQQLDNDGNPVWIQAPTYFTAEEIKARHDAAKVGEDGVDSAPYVIDAGNQAVWGWITLNVEAGESYVIYQQSSQLGFGGYEFNGESYIACLNMGETIALNTEFANVVDADGNATNVDNRGSVVNFGTASMAVEAVGGAEPESVEADFDGTGISVLNAELNVNAPVYNLAGQRVENGFKGLVIQNGKKYMVK
ncbi:MAG: hypothetical protein E7107_05675 [Prevotella sp.]|jgi:hypothetical protein|nr:hypothetical protein [Prevotella sp.]